MSTITARVQRRAALATILVEAGRPRPRPRRTALVTTFHVDKPPANIAAVERRESYSTRASATNYVVLCGVVAVVALALSFAETGWRPLALSVLCAMLAPLLGCISAGAGRSNVTNMSGSLRAPLAVASASFVIFTFLSLPFLPAARACALGAQSASLTILGAGVCSIPRMLKIDALGAPLAAALLLITSAGPFFLAGSPFVSSSIQNFAARLFVVSPLAGCCAAAGTDVLRNDRLYAISTLGSATPLGYPSPLIHGAACALGGLALLTIAAVARRPGAGARENIIIQN